MKGEEENRRESQWMFLRGNEGGWAESVGQHGPVGAGEGGIGFSARRIKEPEFPKLSIWHVYGSYIASTLNCNLRVGLFPRLHSFSCYL